MDLPLGKSRLFLQIRFIRFPRYLRLNLLLSVSSFRFSTYYPDFRSYQATTIIIMLIHSLVNFFDPILAIYYYSQMASNSIYRHVICETAPQSDLMRFEQNWRHAVSGIDAFGIATPRHNDKVERQYRIDRNVRNSMENFF